VSADDGAAEFQRRLAEYKELHTKNELWNMVYLLRAEVEQLKALRAEDKTWYENQLLRASTRELDLRDRITLLEQMVAEDRECWDSGEGV